MKTTKAVYAASVDPITFGHMSVVERSAKVFDWVYVLVSSDPRKQYMFSTKERVTLVRESVKHLHNVEVLPSCGRYTVRHAEELGAHVLIRGLRNSQDLEQEYILARENKKIAPNIETIFIPCDENVSYVSSTLVKSHIGADPQWTEQLTRLVPECVIDVLKKKYILKRAKEFWLTAMHEIGKPKAGEEIFEQIVARYTESHRAYHTLEHIVTMLDDLEMIRDQVSDYTALALAIWYHDYVYDVHKDSNVASNEERSAYHAEKDLERINISPNRLVWILKAILATKHTDECISVDQDTALLLDLDLAILGKEEHMFARYDEGIRKEYSHIPEETFKTKRIEVLKGMLSRELLYKTKHFRAKYEHQAHENMRKLIQEYEK
jgi:pantetheine-phosphate adenylyltransferase